MSEADEETECKRYMFIRYGATLDVPQLHSVQCTACIPEVINKIIT